jgi:hypothetical protein
MITDKQAVDQAYALGIILYLRDDGRLYQQPPGRRSILARNRGPRRLGSCCGDICLVRTRTRGDRSRICTRRDQPQRISRWRPGIGAPATSLTLSCWTAHNGIFTLVLVGEGD